METIVPLTPRELASAISRDLAQYPPQLPLLAGLLRTITNDPAHVNLEPKRNGAWVRSKHHKVPKWLDAPALVAHTINLIASAHLSIELWRSIAGRVFQTSTRVGSDPITRNRVILIETGMAGFQCRLCGLCCRHLNYRNEVQDKDIQRWRHQGRADILRWVSAGRNATDDRVWRIWVAPDTGRTVDKCPFLSSVGEGCGWGCSIHDTKPAICRQYPMSRKHAAMTGCQGTFQSEG